MLEKWLLTASSSEKHKEKCFNRNIRNVQPLRCEQCCFALFCVCVHTLCIIMHISLRCWMRLVAHDMECYQPVMWAGQGDIWLDWHSALLRWCQAEGPGQPPWIPPGPTCKSTRISPISTPLSDKLNVDDWPLRSLNLCKICRLFVCVCGRVYVCIYCGQYIWMEKNNFDSIWMYRRPGLKLSS